MCSHGGGFQGFQPLSCSLSVAESYSVFQDQTHLAWAGYFSSMHPRMHKQDPMSHRIIEKRRRDRMNNCLADLSRLIPSTYMKKGRGRIEKTEIIEMAIKHLKYLQAHPCSDPSNCEVPKNSERNQLCHFRLGFHESMSESVRFLVEIEGFYAGNGACIRLVNHLQKHFDKLINGFPFTQKYSDLDSHEKFTTETMDVEYLLNGIASPESVINFGSDQNRAKTKNHERMDDEKSEESNKISVPTTHNNSNNNHVAQLTAGQSQPRHMLQNSGMPNERIRRNSTGENNPGNALISRPSRTSSCIAHSQFNTSHNKGEEVYKFKNNIKKRFKADSVYHLNPSSLNNGTGESHAVDQNKNILTTETLTPICQELEVNTNVPSSTSTYRCDFSGKPLENSTINDSGVVSNVWDMVESGSNFFTNHVPSNHGQSSASSSGYSTGTETSINRKYQCEQSPVDYSDSTENFSSSSSVSPTSQSCNSGIPVFALHPKGSFYIPLTLDAALVAPYVDTFDENLPSLHPISISVNFCYSGRSIEKIPRNTWEQTNFYVRDRYLNQCGSPDKNVTIPYTISAQN